MANQHLSLTTFLVGLGKWNFKWVKPPVNLVLVILFVRQRIQPNYMFFLVHYQHDVLRTIYFCSLLLQVVPKLLNVHVSSKSAHIIFQFHESKSYLQVQLVEHWLCPVLGLIHLVQLLHFPIVHTSRKSFLRWIAAMTTMHLLESPISMSLSHVLVTTVRFELGFWSFWNEFCLPVW